MEKKQCMEQPWSQSCQEPTHSQPAHLRRSQKKGESKRTTDIECPTSTSVILDLGSKNIFYLFIFEVFLSHLFTFKICNSSSPRSQALGWSETQGRALFLACHPRWRSPVNQSCYLSTMFQHVFSGYNLYNCIPMSFFQVKLSHTLNSWNLAVV